MKQSRVHDGLLTGLCRRRRKKETQLAFGYNSKDADTAYRTDREKDIKINLFLK
jgi:hypothetical protein